MKSCSLYGALGGDLIGSFYEEYGRCVDSLDFPLFKNGCRLTDDSILTLATADKLLNGNDYVMSYRKWAQRYPNSGFSHPFKKWFMAAKPQLPYRTDCNGSIMRCGPIGFACNSMEDVLAEAERSAVVSHDHPEGIKGAQAGALAVFLARTGHRKEDIKWEMEQRFGYIFEQTVNELRHNLLDSSCRCTLPASLQAFFESDSYESAVRNAIYLCGDSDTFATIAGSVALAFYKEMPSNIIAAIERHLTDEMRNVCREFASRFPFDINILQVNNIALPPCRWRGRSWKDSFENVVSRAEHEDVGDILHNMRAGVFQNTVSIVQSGRYYSEKHECVDLPAADDMKDGTCFYCDRLRLRNETASTCHTEVEVVNDDCIIVAKSLKDSGFNPAVLNMASGRNPGGGVLNGAGAQEENIFRRTNLFLSMFQFAPYAEEYGLEKSRYQYPLDQNFGAVYTPDACVFRGPEKDGYPLLDECFNLSFISVPAVNRPNLDGDGNLVAEEVVRIKNKMRTLFRIGLLKGHDSLVLGAWGCGAYRNPPTQIARLFHEVMEEAEFKGKYRKIVFAIIEDHNSRKSHNPEGNLLPFQREFTRRSKPGIFSNALNGFTLLIHKMSGSNCKHYFIDKNRIAIGRNFAMVVNHYHDVIALDEKGHLLEESQDSDMRAKGVLMKTWHNIQTVAAGFDHGMAIMVDGTVVSTGKTRGFDKSQETEQWNHVRFLDACEGHVAAITDSGEIRIVTDDSGYAYPENYKEQIEAIRHARQLAVGWMHAAVLLSDGRVQIVGNSNCCDVGKAEHWSDVMDIDVFGCYFSNSQTVGLTRDGHVLYTGKFADEPNDHMPENWRDIVSVSCGMDFIVGLDCHGKVHACGRNDKGQYEVDDWPRMICARGDFSMIVGIDTRGWIWMTPFGKTNFRITV